MKDSADHNGQTMPALEALIAVINQSLDIDAIINDALDKIMDLFRCRSTQIRLVDFTTNELVVTAHRGYSAEDLAQLTKRRKYGEGLSALSLESGEVFVIEDLNNDPRYGARDGFARRIGRRSLIYFLLRAKGKILGDIVVHYDTVRKYSPEEIQLFISIAHLIGAAIENARSYQEKIEEINERKLAEEALQLKEMQLRTILESTGDGILAVDNAGRVIKTNQRFADLWKILPDLIKNGSDEALLAYVLSQLVNPEAFLEKVHALYGSTTTDFDTILFKDGRILERYSCPLMNEGVINGRVWSFRDITERRRAEEALRNSEKEARRLSQENELIAEIGRIISSTLDIDKVYERFAEKVREIISCDVITINIVNIRENIRTIRYLSGIHFIGRKIGDVAPLSGSVTESIVRKRSGLIVNVKDHKELLRQYPSTFNSCAAGIQTIMGIPLISKDEIIGALILRSVKPAAYTEKDLRLAERVASQIAGAIANAQLFLELQQVQEALKESEAKYCDLYENAPDMYYSLDLVTGVITECNETFLRTTGYSREEVIGRPIFEMYDSNSIEEAKASFQQFQTKGEVRDAERRVKCRDGRVIDVSLNVSAIRDKDGNMAYSRSIWRDITERKEQEAMIRTLSITDQLTGLYNRRGFTTLAEKQLTIAERTGKGLMLLFADVDDLKKINDTLGHRSGDEAIFEAAGVLKEVFRKMDIIARMGGDEFAVMATEVSSEDAEIIKNRLKAQLALHNSRPDRDYTLSLSIGMIYHDPSISRSLDELLSRADSLMYEQKRTKLAIVAGIVQR